MTLRARASQAFDSRFLFLCPRQTSLVNPHTLPTQQPSHWSPRSVPRCLLDGSLHKHIQTFNCPISFPAQGCLLCHFVIRLETSVWPWIPTSSAPTSSKSGDNAYPLSQMSLIPPLLSIHLPWDGIKGLVAFLGLRFQNLRRKEAGDWVLFFFF